jgi:hypothetical protein
VQILCTRSLPNFPFFFNSAGLECYSVFVTVCTVPVSLYKPITHQIVRAQRHPVLCLLFHSRIKKKTEWRITVMSSLNEIFKNKLASGQIIKDDVNGFTSTSDMCFVYVCSCRLQFPVLLFFTPLIAA